MSIFNDETITNSINYNNIENNEENTEEDIYEPVEPIKYNFNALKQLNTDINFVIPEAVKNINVLGYRINTEKQNPFLEFLLIKTPHGLDYLKKIVNVINMTIETTLNVININLKMLLFGLYSNDSTDESNSHFIKCYNGCKIYDENIYLFLDLTKMNISLMDTHRTNDIFFCLIDEILNTGKVCDIGILPNVTKFFTYSNVEKYKFYHLYDDDNKLYEIPKVVYCGINKNKLLFTYTFGVSKDNKSAILGPYYYFTDFKNAMKQASNDLKEGVGGIIRFAIFLGKTKVKTNSLTEDEDLSDIKKEKLSVENEYTNYERMTIRITDYDGNWSNDYDTVILEDIQLDDYVKVKNTPMYVCKEYEQQVSLSYHYINKNSICDGDDSSKGDYLIY